jgi:transposase
LQPFSRDAQSSQRSAAFTLHRNPACRFALAPFLQVLAVSRSLPKTLAGIAPTMHARLSLLLNRCRWPITNAVTEALNSKLQWINYTARGFRSREGFRRAI